MNQDTKSTAPLRLGGATCSWLHRATLDDALDAIADSGLSYVEIMTSQPHLQTSAFDGYHRVRLRRRLAGLCLKPLSLNPSGLDINLVSMHSEVRELGERLINSELELASELGAPFVVLAAGRVHPLAAPPREDALAVLSDAYVRLGRRAGQLGVKIVVETVPYGFLTSGSDVLSLVRSVDSPSVGVVYDVANVLAFEDPCKGLERVRDKLDLVHVSDTRRDRWMHTSPGRGDVDFMAVHRTLVRIGYRGPTVYELLDGELPTPKYDADLAALERAGWSR